LSNSGRPDFLGVKPNANQDDINKAYRKKSKLLHPDKVKRSFIANNSRTPRDKTKGKKPGVHASKGPSQRQIANAVKEANQRSARLNLVANILRGPVRERYDHFLRNGFPTWKGTGYYYSRFRPGLGTVLLGLFLVFGGAGHYAALVLSWKRQREFVERYIRHARKAAWGDEQGIGGIPGLDASAPAVTPPVAEADATPAAAMNRRQKRMMDRENRKDNKKGGKSGGRESASGTATPVTESTSPVGSRKRVVAENGKVLIVDSVGNVFLEEESEDGEKREYLLDGDEIPGPKFTDTVVFQLPIWCYHKTVGRLYGSSKLPDDVAEDTHEDAEFVEESNVTPTGGAVSTTRRRGKRNQKH
jgi:curved DNA-binding protein CbpA